MADDHNNLFEQATRGNRALWDEMTPVHVQSYGVDRFLSGERWLPQEILREVGPVCGKSLLHLQCHFGLDSLAWVREGARVTGIDFSPVAIEAAQRLSQQSGLAADFICSDVYNLQTDLKGSFDIVFSSIGVLCWLKDLDAWAEVIAYYLKPDGFFYLMDGHPLIYTFEDDHYGQFKFSYFHRHEPYFWDAGAPDYMDPEYITQHPSYEWQWSVSDIINAVLKAGLQLTFFNEFGAMEDPVYPDMIQRADGLYTFPDLPVPLPIIFSLKAQQTQGR